MTHVALMPERLVLCCRCRVSTQDACKSGNAFTLHRVAFLWHGRTSRLATAERLTNLVNLRVLQVANLCCKSFECAARDRDRGNKCGVPIALHDLCADWIHTQAERGEHLALNRGINLAIRPNRA